MNATHLPDYTAADYEHMAHALRLARHGLYTAHPNPRVGCVLVNDGRVVGEGWHRKTGSAHAEVAALEDAGDKARGATAYVTLEPCAHHGKTPPCVDALIAAGVSGVIAAMADPNSLVAGKGHKALEDAGVSVRSGLLQDEASGLNAGFLSRMQRARPFVRLKMAASLDGRTAMSNGQSQWITGTASRRDVQRLRAMSGAVMVGIGTVLADDPGLTVRLEELDNDGVQPLRVVLDRELKMPPAARMLRLPGETAVFCAAGNDPAALLGAGARVFPVAGGNGGLDLAAVLAGLAELEVNDVLVEAGQLLAGSLLGAGLVDELVIYQAPHIMGSETRGMFATPDWLTLERRQGLDIIDVRKIGADTRITAIPAQ
jgi:diaminohydroxyphosphoribosylaminopyrimidine deaminase/5-amino-6-(5-phosphoribosylamino)uracil reductase